MFARIVTPFVLSFAVAAGALAAAERTAMAQTPAAAPSPPPKPAMTEQEKEKIPARQAAVRRQAIAVARQSRGHRLLPARLPARRRRAAGQRAHLAGDAAVAQPQLGPSQPGPFLERFAPLAAKATGWNGILVGDWRSRAAGRRRPTTPATRSASTSTSGSCRCPTTC